eukprot:3419271-Pleurochrysis_carterae.AAC.5
MAILPISTQGKENMRPDLTRFYPSSVTQNGLRSYLSSSRSGAHVHPNHTTHAFIWRVPLTCYLLGIYLKRPSGAGGKMLISTLILTVIGLGAGAQARGLGAPTGRLKEGGAQRAGATIASRLPRA